MEKIILTKFNITSGIKIPEETRNMKMIKKHNESYLKQTYNQYFGHPSQSNKARKRNNMIEI